MLICIPHKASMGIQVTNYNYWAISTGRVSVDLYYKDALIGHEELPEGLTIVSRGDHIVKVAATQSGDAQDIAKALAYYSKDCEVKSNTWVLTAKITVYGLFPILSTAISAFPLVSTSMSTSRVSPTRRSDRES